MAASSLSTLPFTPSFPPNSNPDSHSTSASLRPTSFKLFKPHHLLPKSASLRHSNPPFKVFVSSSNLSVEHGSAPEQFPQNNSVTRFLRFKRGSDGGCVGELQTAVVSYRMRFPWSLDKPPIQVDLVSTVHIADKEYFETLQKTLVPYDCVLYEMVTSRENLEKKKSNTTMAKGLKGSCLCSRSVSILSCIQRQMARILMLDFQLDCLHYEAENWYHADLDFETFQLLQFERGESFFTFVRDMSRRSTKSMAQPASIQDMQSQASEYPDLEAFSRLEFGAALKILLAVSLTSSEQAAYAEVEDKSVIIGERNRTATEALRRAIHEGHNKIAILYGAGHMPDLGRRLRDEFDMIPFRVQWMTAWSIRDESFEFFQFLKDWLKFQAGHLTATTLQHCSSSLKSMCWISGLGNSFVELP